MDPNAQCTEDERYEHRSGHPQVPRLARHSPAHGCCIPVAHTANIGFGK